MTTIGPAIEPNVLGTPDISDAKVKEQQLLRGPDVEGTKEANDPNAEKDGR
jgi:hypothetical protein